jgi:Na+/proline symporter
MAGLERIDIIIILVYFVVVVILGIVTSFSVKNTGDFFIGGRRFGKFVTMMLHFGAGTHADQAVAVSSKVYQVGLSGIWYQWLYLFVTPFYWILAPILRRLRVVTTADYFHKRFGLSVATLYALLAIVILMQNMGLMLQSSGFIVEAVTRGGIPFSVSVLSLTVLFVIYGMAGGLVSAAIIDVFQGFLTIIMSFMILPYAIIHVGGFKGLHEKLAGASYDLFSLVSPGEITIFFIVVTVINGAVGYPTQPHALVICASSKNEMTSRIGTTYGNFIKRFCTVAWAFTGLCCIALFPTLQRPDHAFGEAARLLLPSGMIGVMLVAVLASVQAGCSALMVTASGTFTRNIYRVFFGKGKSESHYLLVGRVTSLLIVCGGLCFAFFIPSAVKALELFWQVPAFMGIAFFLGIVWRRANTATVWISFLVTTSVFFLCEFDFFIGYEVPLVWQIFWYLTLGLIAGVITGFITKPQSKAFLDTFYNELNTPVENEEHLATDLMGKK